MTETDKLPETTDDVSKDEDAEKQVTEEVSEELGSTTMDLEALKFDAAVPESIRAIAENSVNQTREAYERGKEALDGSIDALERSLDAAGQGASAFNHKLMEIAQRNLTSSFDLARSLASAKDVTEFVELQSTFIRNQFDAFTSQASEIQALTTKIAADTSEPLKSQMTKSLEAARKAS